LTYQARCRAALTPNENGTSRAFIYEADYPLNTPQIPTRKPFFLTRLV
jgi:hypothetical protein